MDRRDTGGGIAGHIATPSHRTRFEWVGSRPCSTRKNQGGLGLRDEITFRGAARFTPSC